MRVVRTASPVFSKNLIFGAVRHCSFRTRQGVDYPRPMHPLAPPENGIKASLSHLPMNLSGLKVNGSSQYRAAWFFVNYLGRLAGKGDSYDCNEVQRR